MTEGPRSKRDRQKDHGDLECAPGGRPRVDARQAGGRDLRFYPTIARHCGVGWADLRMLDGTPVLRFQASSRPFHADDAHPTRRSRSSTDRRTARSKRQKPANSYLLLLKTMVAQFLADNP